MTTPQLFDDGFSAFWDAYPRRVAKKAAQKAWAKLKLSPAEQQTILDALEWQTRSAEWTHHDGRYIPYPSSYLTGGRWEDAPPRHVQRVQDWHEECRQVHGGTCDKRFTHWFKMERDTP
jgi:hypothetical protein